MEPSDQIEEVHRRPEEAPGGPEADSRPSFPPPAPTEGLREEGPGPIARWRRFAMLLAVAAAGFLLLQELHPRLLRSAELWKEGRKAPELWRRGRLVPDSALLDRRDRLQLRVELGRPAAILVLLQSGEGKVLDLQPPPEMAVQLLPGPSVRLPDGPGVEAFWDTAELDRGRYFLWVLAAKEPVSAARRAVVRSRLEGLKEEVREVLLEHADLEELRALVLGDLRPDISEGKTWDLVVGH